MICVKYFSALIAALILFTFSAAYADVAPYPRPRPQPHNIGVKIVTAKITKDNKLLLKFKLPAACDYKYKIYDTDSEEVIKLDEGSYDGNKTVTATVDLPSLSRGEQRYYEVNVRMYNLREQTRFGEKITDSVRDVTNTIRFQRDCEGNDIDVRVYAGGFY